MRQKFALQATLNLSNFKYELNLSMFDNIQSMPQHNSKVCEVTNRFENAEKELQWGKLPLNIRPEATAQYEFKKHLTS